MTASVHVLDPYYLGISLLVTTGYQLLGFAIAWTCQFDKITDFTGGKLYTATFKEYMLSICMQGPISSS
jgi:hypothetical protein